MKKVILIIFMVIGQISLADQLYKANLNKFADIKVVRVSSEITSILTLRPLQRV